MTRRLRFAGMACVALAMPACITMPNERVVRPWPNGPQQRLAGVKVPPPAEVPPPSEQFAEHRTGPIIQEMPAPIPMGTPLKEVDTVGYKPEQLEPARITLPPVKGEALTPTIEPVPDKEGVIRPAWPTLRETPIGESIPPVKTIPTVESPKELVVPPANSTLLAPPAIAPIDHSPAITAPPPVIPPMKTPEALPPSIIAPPNHQTRSSPLGREPMANELRMAAEREGPALAQHDSPLIKAIRALQENRPAEAAAQFRQHDPATQQLLLALLPPVLHLAEGKLANMKPEEVDVLLDQLTRVPNMLRTRASLQVHQAMLCREVHSFAKVEPFPARHQFRSGDMVHLYVELANFSCVPEPKGGYAISLGSTLEVRDAAGSLVWRADPKEEPDRVTTAPMDYYRAYRFSVPNLAGGTYTLGIRLVDRPTGREVRKSIEFRVGAR